MKSIKALIQELNVLRNTNEYKYLSLIDEHISSIENRIDNIEKRNMRYYCRVYRNAIQTIPNGVLTAIVFNQTEYPQFGNMHDNVNSNNQIHIRRDGVYYITGGVQFASNSSGTYREVGIYLIRGGVTAALAIHSNGPLGAVGVSLHLPVSTVYYLRVGDSLFLGVLHNVVAGLDIEVDFPHSPYLAASERMEDLSPDQYGLLNPEANMR